MEEAFAITRFKNWKKNLQRENGFPLHDECDAHSYAVERFLKKDTDESIVIVKVFSKPSALKESR